MAIPARLPAGVRSDAATPSRLRWLGSLMALTCALAVTGLAQSPGVDRAAWREDYTFLKQALVAHYANLAWFGSPEGGVDVPALDRQTLASLDAAPTDAEARAALLAFVRSFHDGHFSALRAPAVEAPESPAPPPVYSRRDPAAGCAALGYAPYEAAAFSAPFEAAGTFQLLTDGVATPFRAGLLTAGSAATRIGIVRIPEFENTHPSLCREAWQQDDVWDAQGGRLLRGPLRRAVEQRWYHALADLLQTFKQ